MFEIYQQSVDQMLLSITQKLQRGVLCKKGKGTFLGIAGYLPPLGVPQFMSTLLIYPCTAQKVAAVGSRCQPNFG